MRLEVRRIPNRADQRIALCRGIKLVEKLVEVQQLEESIQNHCNPSIGHPTSEMPNKLLRPGRHGRVIRHDQKEEVHHPLKHGDGVNLLFNHGRDPYA